MSQYADMLTLLDSSLTGDQFERCIQNHKLLHDCKTKGFEKLKKLGLIVVPERLPELTKEEKRDKYKQLAIDAEKLVKSGMTIDQAAGELGVKGHTVNHHCRRHGIKLKPRRVRRKKATDEMINKTIDLINEDGYRVYQACKITDIAHATFHQRIAEMGLAYDKTKVRIEPCRK